MRKILIENDEYLVTFAVMSEQQQTCQTEEDAKNAILRKYPGAEFLPWEECTEPEAEEEEWTMGAVVDGELVAQVYCPGGKIAQVFESMWEYIDENGATVEDYVLSPAEFEGKKIIRSFRPVDDVFFVTFSQDQVLIGDQYYQHVNWGEDEYCLIPEGEVDAKLWIIYEWNEKGGEYCTRGQIFQTEDEASEAMEEGGH